MFGTEQKKYVTRRQFLTSAAAAVAGTAVAACAPKPATPTTRCPDSRGLGPPSVSGEPLPVPPRPSSLVLPRRRPFP
ncbi:twin-arginine translocation signal domain-containing protein [Candidatus Solincola tengchongensis]|uniref:twin-arginine translocation signal domain-containing protein n=1 Tax=Candidatus Solincola tengchongensis TaxID=2900693 RepID=UPI003312FC24